MRYRNNDRRQFRSATPKLLVNKKVKIALRILEPVKVSDLKTVLVIGAVPMWYGYAIEAIYTILGTVLIAIVLGILIYQ
jgi:hypothetical protein